MQACSGSSDKKRRSTFRNWERRLPACSARCKRAALFESPRLFTIPGNLSRTFLHFVSFNVAIHLTQNLGIVLQNRNQRRIQLTELILRDSQRFPHAAFGVVKPVERNVYVSQLV